MAKVASQAPRLDHSGENMNREKISNHPAQQPIGYQDLLNAVAKAFSRHGQGTGIVEARTGNVE